MTGSSNNNTRQVIINQRDRGDRTWRTVSRGRNSPMPNRNFKGGQSSSRFRPLPMGESSWYRIIVSMIDISIITHTYTHGDLE